MEYAIETKGLTKRYKDYTAVKNLNIQVKQGEIFALLGVNGAGKTTTIKMLSCLSAPTEGDATLLGNSILKNGEEVKKIINISPQETAIAPQLTVCENLEFIAGVYGLKGKQAKEKAKEMLETFGLTDVSKNRAKTLSGGQQRRLSIAMALISDPKILFLDEPTLGIDILARRELWNTIEHLRGKVTIILTTHYMEEAEQLSDTIAILNKGELRAVGTVEELLRQTGEKNFEDAFVSLATA